MPEGERTWITVVNGEEVYRSHERLFAIDRALSHLGVEEAFNRPRFRVISDAEWNNGEMVIKVVEA